MIAGIRVTYYAEDKDDLLVQCILPFAADATTRHGISAAWVKIHWRFGPHVVLYLSGSEAAVTAQSRAYAGKINDYLTLRPSEGAINETDYLAMSDQLGRLELLEPPYGPLAPDNDVQIVGNPGGDTFVRTQRAVEVKAEILANGLSLMSEEGWVGRSAADNLLTVFEGMVALACNYPLWGLKSGYQAFLSHWKEYFHQADRTGTIEAALHVAFEAQQATLVDSLQAIQTAVQKGEESTPWTKWIDKSWPLAMQLAEAGEVLPFPHPDRLVQAAKFGETIETQWSGSDSRDYSDFHQMFRQLDFTKLGNGPDFAAYRFLINCYFDLLPLMKISPMQRYSMAYFQTSAAQIVLGESWEETIQKSVDRQNRNSGEVVPTLPWRGASHL